MKKWTLLLVLSLFWLTACCKRGDRNNTAATAVVAPNAINANCLNTGTFNNNLYTNGNCGTFNNYNGVIQQYPVQNGYYQGYQNQYQQGFNGCPFGTIPSYSAHYGLNCIDASYIQNMQNLAYWQWSPTTYNFNFYGYYTQSHYNYYSYDYQHVVQSCTTNTQCGLGVCMGFNGGDFSLGLSLGLCGNNEYDYGYDYYDDGGYYKAALEKLGTSPAAVSNSGGGKCGF